MITVSIFINGNPIITRSAVNKGKVRDGFSEYAVDDGSKVYHKQSDGPVKLAKMLLDTVKEP